MLSTQISAAQQRQSLPPASRGAGAANGSWIDVRDLEGQALIDIQIGAVTGNVTVKLQDATDIGGTGAADVAGLTTAALTAANTPARIAFVPGATRGFVRIVATVVTGPVLCGAAILGHSKYT